MNTKSFFKNMLAFGFAFLATNSQAEPVSISLENYTFDFATIGYEISLAGNVSNFSEPLEGSDYTTISDGGYSMKVRNSALSRKGKRDLTNKFNESCVGFSVSWPAIISGEMQLDEDMQVNLYARSFTLMGTEYK